MRRRRPRGTIRERAVERLRARLDAHLVALRGAAAANEFLDLATAEELHRAMVTALDEWEHLPDEKQRVLADAIDHLVTIHDTEDDAASPIGLDDDREVVESALRVIRTG